MRLADIANEPRVVLSRRAEPELHRHYFGPAEDPAVQVRIEAEQIDTVLALVAAGVGIAHAPASVSRLTMEGVVARPLRPRLPAGISLVWNPDRLPPAARHFRDALLAQRDH